MNSNDRSEQLTARCWHDGDANIHSHGCTRFANCLLYFQLLLDRLAAGANSASFHSHLLTFFPLANPSLTLPSLALHVANSIWYHPPSIDHAVILERAVAKQLSDIASFAFKYGCDHRRVAEYSHQHSFAAFLTLFESYATSGLDKWRHTHINKLNIATSSTASAALTANPVSSLQPKLAAAHPKLTAPLRSSKLRPTPAPVPPAPWEYEDIMSVKYERRPKRKVPHFTLRCDSLTSVGLIASLAFCQSDCR